MLGSGSLPVHKRAPPWLKKSCCVNNLAERLNLFKVYAVPWIEYDPYNKAPEQAASGPTKQRPPGPAHAHTKAEQ